MGKDKKACNLCLFFRNFKKVFPVCYGMSCCVMPVFFFWRSGFMCDAVTSCRVVCWQNRE